MYALFSDVMDWHSITAKDYTTRSLFSAVKLEGSEEDCSVVVVD